MRLLPVTAWAFTACHFALAQSPPLPDQNITPLPKKNEVSVVLDDPDPPPLSQPPETVAPAKAGDKTPPVSTNPANSPKTPADAPSQPGPVTSHPHATADAAPAPEKEPETKPETGVTVRVEKLQIHSKKIDPAKVTLVAPFPAKPLADPPPGWKLDVRADAKPFFREIEIAPGANISLSIRPHVLVPIADGISTFNVNEPGFEPERQYQQLGTVGAILTDSVETLDNQARQLGDAIDRIQQLLVSLPSSPQPLPTVLPPPPVAPRKTEPLKKR